MPDKPKPISPLRQRMIDEMTARRFSEATRKEYVRHVRTFAAFLDRSPDTATSEDAFAAFSCICGAAASQPLVDQRRHRRTAVFFTVTLERPDLVRPLRLVNEPRKAPVVLSREEAARLLEARAGPQVQGRAQRRLRRGPLRGVRGREPESVRHRRASALTLRVEQGKGQRDRYVMLSPQLLELPARLVAGGAACRSRSSFPARTRSIRSPPSSSIALGHRRQGSGGHLQARIAAHLAAA